MKVRLPPPLYSRPHRPRRPMSETDLRIDPLTGASVIVTPWRQHRPNQPDGLCPFCPGGLEAPRPYEVLHIPNRWPALPNGCHEVVLHSPDHHASFPALGGRRSARVVELWSARTAALGARDDVGYVFVFENRGRVIGTTIEHPHSQVMAFHDIPPIPRSELTAGDCGLCQDSAEELTVTCGSGWQARVPWAPSWPYEMLLSPRGHVAQRPTTGNDWPAAHLHLHLAPAQRAPGVMRHLAAAELGAGVFFDPVDPREAAAQLRSAQ